MIHGDTQLQNGYVTATVQGGIAAIEFFHPQSNSLPGALLTQLAGDITAAGNDSNVQVIILRSAGEKAFCAGASFTELTAIQTEQEGLDFFSGFARVINAMRKCPKFIIARIQGKCVGGGVGLAAGADYAIATTNADIKLSELAIGIGPFVIGPAVERKIGLAAFSQLGIDASNWYSAAWALQKGLYAQVCDSTEAMDEAVTALAGTLSQSSPGAMAEMKQMFWQGTSHWDELLYQRAAISGTLVLSAFTRNAIAAFKQKGK